jgi:hypothetical protein
MRSYYAVFSYDLASATSPATTSIRPGHSHEWEAMIIRSGQQTPHAIESPYQR